MIKDRENGLLVDFFSPDQVANRVDEVLDHPDRMRQTREQARKTIVGGYDLLTTCLPEQVKLVENLAGR